MVYISPRDEGTLPKTRDNNNNREVLTAHPLDYMRNSIARTAAQIRPSHWRPAVYLKRIRKMAKDKCWFCQNSARMTRSHVLLHYPSAKLRAAKAEAWEWKDPGGVRVLLANPRWERRFVKFLDGKDDG
jgi:hypothetical protein